MTEKKTAEENCNETPREDKMRDALAHYEELAAIACWHRSDIPEAIRAYYDAPSPSSATAEEINKRLAESLGEPDNSIEDHSYEIRPLTVEGRREWWIFHNGVGSGEPLTQWLSKFATLHAQKIADKMVEAILRDELEKFGTYFNEIRCPYVVTSVIDEYLKNVKKS